MTKSDPRDRDDKKNFLGMKKVKLDRRVWLRDREKVGRSGREGTHASTGMRETGKT